jgi:Contact-dependent growth inhibition CdiA C-terminal domain
LPLIEKNLHLPIILMRKTNAKMQQLYQLIYTSPNGGSIEIHQTHQQDERAENLFFAKILADNNKYVRLLPHSNERNIKNPDAEVDGHLADFKRASVPTHRAIQWLIEKANTQGVEIAIIFLNHPDFTTREIKRALIGALAGTWNKNIKEVWLINLDLEIQEIKRQEIIDRTFWIRLL